MLEIRQAGEGHVDGIIEIFRASYGDGYTYPEFYDPSFLKGLVFNREVDLLVAVEETAVLGTAAIVMESGAYSDLVGEFGRLAVHPEARGKGVGNALMEARLERARERLHVAFMEARVAHPFSVKIADKYGFAPVGFLPMKLRFSEHRESGGVMARYFGQALELRRNHPRMVPELHELATVALENVGLRPDPVVDEETPAYPHDGGFEIEQLTTEGYSDLLRIERGRLRRREVFGRLRLHYGLFRLSESSARYLIARDGSRVVGGIGYIQDRHEGVAVVFEVIAADELAVRQLFEELERRCEEDPEIVITEVDVGADATRMQRTLVELGYLPAAYVPALSFHEVERVDVVRMLKLRTPIDVSDLSLHPAIRDVADRVLDAFYRYELTGWAPELAERVGLFRGLTDEQAGRLTLGFTRRRFEPGKMLFSPGDAADAMLVILDGKVAVETESGSEVELGPGDVLGEGAFLEQRPHAAWATAREPVRAVVLERTELERVIRSRPDIGTALYRNLSRELMVKLERTTRERG